MTHNFTFPGPYSEKRTAREIEKANPGLEIEVLPLPEPKVVQGDYGALIISDFSVQFNNHPYVRSTEYGELIYFCDHAGRHQNRFATHVAVQRGTRLHNLIINSFKTVYFYLSKQLL